MSAIHKRFNPRRRGGKSHVPAIAGAIVILGLAIFVFRKFDSIKQWFEPTIITEKSDEEANRRLDKLMGSLSGDRIAVLQLARDYTAKVAWIKEPKVRRQFEWILMNRLIELGEWAEARKILPGVISIANAAQLDAIAREAQRHEDYELQLQIERQIQEQQIDAKAPVGYLLQSLQRSVATDMKLQRKENAIKSIARLDMPAVQARIETPAQAATAAALQLQRASLSEVKEPIYVQVRAILERANWPACPATSLLVMEEVRSTLTAESKLTPAALKELEAKMKKCVESMLASGDRNRSLPSCYMMLGDIRNRLGDAPGCVQALSLAGAFAEGFGEMTPELRLRIARVRSRANAARHAVEEALPDLRFLAERDTDPHERIRALLILAEHTHDAEQIEALNQCWKELSETGAAYETRDAAMADIASRLAAHYMEENNYPLAAEWYDKTARLQEKLHPDLTEGSALQARYQYATAQLKAKNDGVAARGFIGVIRAIEAFSEEEEAAFKKNAPNLYKQAVRNLARAYLFMKERSLAKAVIKKIKEDLPDAAR